jgi:NAD(P)-dependent dehydrogenase (short-subunit alcohol dehydrogenase family)
MIEMSQTVVITGASAGIGRATARLYGARGASVGLIARGEAGLDGAVRDVEDAGGKALMVAADVADHRQVEDAARQIEEAFGPIDVWVNVAFASVFAQFADLTPDEFRRVTEVSYLGFVHGTMAALRRMRPRDRGVIVQVGSALGARSIPLQSAYCGAKHAINGFTSALRCELLHEKSGVQVTVVQLPAVNTPQFSWVRSRLPDHPQPVPPIYQPEVAARGVVFAADHPRRKQYWVGASTAATILANKFAPALLDRYLALTGYKSQQTSQKIEPDRPDNLWQPVDGRGGHDHGGHGIFGDRSHARSAQLWVSQRARLSAIASASAASAAILARATRAARAGRAGPPRPLVRGPGRRHTGRAALRKP